MRVSAARVPVPQKLAEPVLKDLLAAVSHRRRCDRGRRNKENSESTWTSEGRRKLVFQCWATLLPGLQPQAYRFLRSRASLLVNREPGLQDMALAEALLQ